MKRNETLIYCMKYKDHAIPYVGMCSAVNTPPKNAYIIGVVKYEDARMFRSWVIRSLKAGKYMWQIKEESESDERVSGL